MASIKPCSTTRLPFFPASKRRLKHSTQGDITSEWFQMVTLRSFRLTSTEPPTYFKQSSPQRSPGYTNRIGGSSMRLSKRWVSKRKRPPTSGIRSPLTFPAQKTQGSPQYGIIKRSASQSTEYVLILRSVIWRKFWKLSNSGMAARAAEACTPLCSLSRELRLHLPKSLNSLFNRRVSRQKV